MSLDLKLNFGDKTIDNLFLSGKELIMQRVTLSLQCWVGDWFLDSDYGIPYDLRLENKGLLLADVENVILGVKGVSSVQDLNIEIVYEIFNNKKVKCFKINGTVITDEEQTGIINNLIPILGL